MTSPTLQNPWLSLPPRAPFIAPPDREPVLTFNERVPSDDQLNLDLLPIPYLGNPDAPIVLLNLNPGHHPDADHLQSTPKFKKACRACHQHAPAEYPFFFLDPKIEGNEPGPGHRWWTRIFSRLLEEFSPQFPSRQFFCVEYFPYRSRSYQPLSTILPSQEYGFSLIRQAMKRKALIIIMRSRRLWFRAVPELESYANLIVLRNPRNPVPSEGNAPEGFKAIQRLLKRA